MKLAFTFHSFSKKFGCANTLNMASETINLKSKLRSPEDKSVRVSSDSFNMHEASIMASVIKVTFRTLSLICYSCSLLPFLSECTYTYSDFVNHCFSSSILAFLDFRLTILFLFSAVIGALELIDHSHVLLRQRTRNI